MLCLTGTPPGGFLAHLELQAIPASVITSMIDFYFEYFFLFHLFICNLLNSFISSLDTYTFLPSGSLTFHPPPAPLLVTAPLTHLQMSWSEERCLGCGPFTDQLHPHPLLHFFASLTCSVPSRPDRSESQLD